MMNDDVHSLLPASPLCTPHAVDKRNETTVDAAALSHTLYSAVEQRRNITFVGMALVLHFSS